MGTGTCSCSWLRFENIIVLDSDLKILFNLLEICTDGEFICFDGELIETEARQRVTCNLHLFWWWIDLIDDPPNNMKQVHFYDRKLFCCRFGTDCLHLQRREDSPSWTGRRTSRNEMPVQDFEIWKLYFWLCSNIVRVCKLQEKKYKSWEPFNLFFFRGVVFTLLYVECDQYLQCIMLSLTE